MKKEIIVNKNTKIFVCCPSNIATGGPELLHQFAYHLLNDLGINAIMYYIGFNSEKHCSPVHPDYELYKIPFVLEINKNDDIDSNFLIVPEIYPCLKLLESFLKLKKIVWFLGITPYYFSQMKRNDFYFKKKLNRLMDYLNMPHLYELMSETNLNKLKKKYNYTDNKLLKYADFYFANSYRTLQWFNKLQPIFYLSEYLNKDFLTVNIDYHLKENMVVYNPTKGEVFLSKLIKASPHIKYVPIINMSRKQVIETLTKAKVYIDFWNLGSKDRLLRESAILGCCLITSKKGIASCYEDLPIPDSYKIEDKNKNIPSIIKKIEDCFENYYERTKDFEYYREIIRNEPAKFIEDLKKIFIVQ